MGMGSILQPKKRRVDDAEYADAMPFGTGTPAKAGVDAWRKDKTQVSVYP